MTAHRRKPSGSRARPDGAAHARSRHRRRGRGSGHGAGRASGARGGRGAKLGGLAAVAVLALAGSLAVGWNSASSTTGGVEAGAATQPSASGSLPASASPSRSASPSSSASPSGSASASRGGKSSASAAPSGSAVNIPASGPGTYTTAQGQGARVGSGKVLRYRVDVERGIALSAADVADEVEDILADKRGWTADGRSAFQRVSGGTTDFVVQVATPGTVDEVCGRYGLDTGGRVNCSVDKHVMVNLRRWLLATPVYADDVPAYRALIINHEVGHFLKHGHVGCPGPGKPAPAMMQQIKGMFGCEPNVWPYDEAGRYITGPAVP